MTATPKVRRTRRDPAEKAADALGVAERRVSKLQARREALAADLDAATGEHALALEERKYLAQSPHLTRKAASVRVVDP